jgi:hypothetical protein
MRFAYADPPYPGKARRCYGRQADYAGEVDHAALVAQLVAAGFDGWALSTGAYALRELLPLCPEGARVCAWVKPVGVSRHSRGLHNAWEPLIVVGGRQIPPGRRDWLRAHPARSGGDLIGRKPIAFSVWAFECLGMQAGDELVDLFPGSGAIMRAWREFSRAQPSQAPGDGYPSPRSPGDGLARGKPAARNASQSSRSDASRPAVSDASPPCRRDASRSRAPVLPHQGAPLVHCECPRCGARDALHPSSANVQHFDARALPPAFAGVVPEGTPVCHGRMHRVQAGRGPRSG